VTRARCWLAQLRNGRWLPRLSTWPGKRVCLCVLFMCSCVAYPNAYLNGEGEFWFRPSLCFTMQCGLVKPLAQLNCIWFVSNDCQWCPIEWQNYTGFLEVYDLLSMCRILWFLSFCVIFGYWYRFDYCSSNIYFRTIINPWVSLFN